LQPLLRENYSLLTGAVLYAIHGISANTAHKDALLRNLPYLGIMGVGIGSAVFHASMKNYTQWCMSFHLAVFPGLMMVGIKVMSCQC
jgi:hypothetical membrane protein